LEYTKLDKKLQDQYSELLRNQVPNKVEIYYHNKLLKHHSIGQRASALILFILMQSDNDIILIDGKELLRLMIAYNVGVETKEIIELKKIDLDFFDDED